MIFGQDRGELRQMYVDAWRKLQAKKPLTPLESQIAQVVGEHPEYHATILHANDDDSFLPEDGATNPFLHMGLHLAIREQVATDRPPGIAALFRSILARCGDAHAAEHQALECLAETLWEAQRSNAMPDENAYLERLRRIAA